MGWLNSEKPPEKWSPAYFKLFVERIRTAFNYIDDSNFPEGLSGLVLKDRSVPLKTKVTGYGGLVISHDFFALPVGVSVTATSLTSLGSSVLWSPSWKNIAKPYLEVTAYVADANYPATLEVHGVDGSLMSQQITNTTISRLEWEIPTPPTTSQTLVFKSLVTNSTYPLTILSARLILKLTESI